MKKSPQTGGISLLGLLVSFPYDLDFCRAFQLLQVFRERGAKEAL